VKPRLLWDAGPGEIRAGLIHDDDLTAFRLIRLRRRETAVLAVGEHYTAQIISRMGDGQALVSLGVSLGVETQAILRPCPPLTDGARLAVEMVRAPIPEPGRWKRALVRPADGLTPQAEPCWHFSAEPWERFLQQHAPLVEAILCPTAGVANEVQSLLGPSAPPVSVDPGAIEDADFDALMEQAAAGEFPIDGGTLTIERTRAMTVIDVDGTTSAVALNLAAARAIPKLLHLLDIGGPVGIDFVSMRNRADRLAVDQALREAAACLGTYEKTAINGFGFCQMIRPRTGPSVPELLCGITPGQLSRESRAIALLRIAGRSQGTGTRRLVAPPAIIDLIRAWPEEIAALKFQLGTAIELVPDASASGYGYVHVDQG
jgi:ribonuclease G